MNMLFDENEKNGREKPSLDETLQALQSTEDGVIPARAHYGLSNLSPAEIERLKPVWRKLSSDLRCKLLLELGETSELNFDLDYRELGLFALQDEDSRVRASAIELLWLDESLELMSRLIDLSQWDDDYEVRAAAVSALGRFILLGEYEEIPEREAVRVQDAAINLLTNDQEELEVRRRALEAISNSSHEIVTQAIQEAYEGTERLMQVSSIFAMGRSCDQHWRDIILKEMNSDDEEIRYEAARAAGELQFDEAVAVLGRLVVRDEREIQEAAVWSLGEIGGREALRILSALAEDIQESDDGDFLEAIEDAISNATLVGELVGSDIDEDD